MDNLNRKQLNLNLPSVAGAFEDLKRICRKKAVEKYGACLSPVIAERLADEFAKVGNDENASPYLHAAKAVTFARERGYRYGSWGGVGSMLVSALLGLSEVNPLPAHYYCSRCRHIEFSDAAEDGFDLPDIPCPVCGTVMRGDGHNIPSESFTGFFGEKPPDIVLTFPYALFDPRLFCSVFGCDAGQDGVISGDPSCQGSAGPGPAALHLIGLEVFDRLDRFETRTGERTVDVRFNDANLYRFIREESGFADIGELGDDGFDDRDSVAFIISLIGPHCFSDLVRAFGLAHGSGTWEGNGKKLLTAGTCTLADAICFREDIMLYLLKCGFDRESAYRISDFVRRGMAAKMPDDLKNKLRSPACAGWYFDSCLKIRYLFPKAHGIEWCMNAVRLLS